MIIKTEMENIFLIKNIFLIINAINIFSTGGDKLVEVMTVASVPSTLVKCLYLFFDLAEVMTGASVPSTLVKCLYLFFDLPKGR